jgi:hypothetical protein
MSDWDEAETSKDAWPGVKAGRCDENALKILFPSSVKPEDRSNFLSICGWKKID